jgi:hypothetical protein
MFRAAYSFRSGDELECKSCQVRASIYNNGEYIIHIDNDNNYYLWGETYSLEYNNRTSFWIGSKCFHYNEYIPLLREDQLSAYFERMKKLVVFT